MGLNKRAYVREPGASPHQGGVLKSLSKPSNISTMYGAEGFEGRIAPRGDRCDCSPALTFDDPATFALRTQRNLFEILSYQPEIRLYLPFSD